MRAKPKEFNCYLLFKKCIFSFSLAQQKFSIFDMTSNMNNDSSRVASTVVNEKESRKSIMLVRVNGISCFFHG